MPQNYNAEIMNSTYSDTAAIQPSHNWMRNLRARILDSLVCTLETDKPEQEPFSKSEVGSYENQ